MPPLVRVVVAALAAYIVYISVVLYGAVAGWWRDPVASHGDTEAFREAAARMIETAAPGNVALVLLEAGDPAAWFFDSIGEPVDRDTRYQVASLSKWITAWGVMTLVEKGQIELDQPVNRYLTRWKLPASEFDTGGVTVRRLLSHTAGLVDGLGFAGYPPDETLPTLEEALDNPRSFGVEPTRIIVGQQPGAAWAYSGGGYLVLQLLIEEVTGESFADYLRSAVLNPLGMSRSTFVHPAADSGLAETWDTGRQPARLYRYTASSAAGFYTSLDDMIAFLRAHLPEAGHRVLTAPTIRAMRDPEAFVFGLPLWGLGPMLYARTDAGDYVFGHEGRNFPAINTSARFNPDTGDGIVVFVSGAENLASEIGDAWTLWQTGRPATARLEREIARTIPSLFGGGLLMGLVLSVLVVRLRGKRVGGER